MTEVDPLTPQQTAILRRATPEELEFTVMFARHYVGGRKFLCWTARAIVAFGMIAAALASVLALFGAVVTITRPHP